MITVKCSNNHSGNNHLTRSNVGRPHWECDGCGAMYVELVVTSKPGMTPYATETTLAAARKSSRAAKMLGLDGEIVAR